MKRLMVLLASLSICGWAPVALAGETKSILITGASTGIGRNLAETLAAEGYHVYAGARKDADLAELDAIENITAVRLDVTRQDQVDAVVALIREKGTGLWGLVNNAGVGGGGPVVDTPVDDQNFVYRVNVEGVYRTTQAFAPFVIESKGRITTTGSIAGTGSWAGGSAYSGSKHWIEAFTDALAMEMQPQGVSVSVIEPGNYKSNIRRTRVARMLGVDPRNRKSSTRRRQSASCLTRSLMRSPRPSSTPCFPTRPCFATWSCPTLTNRPGRSVPRCESSCSSTSGGRIATAATNSSRFSTRR